MEKDNKKKPKQRENAPKDKKEDREQKARERDARREDRIRERETVSPNWEPSSSILLVDQRFCKPKKCGLECSSKCPVNSYGKVCVEASRVMKAAEVNEKLCIGCGICVKKCPFGAIRMTRIYEKLQEEIVHWYGKSQFRLIRLPQPRLGKVLGILGSNGTGKTTALSILTTRIQPNLGNLHNQPSWQEISKHFKGQDLQNYFQGFLEGQYKAAMKPQYVDSLPKVISGKVKDIIQKKDQLGMAEEYYHRFGLWEAKDKDLKDLSGGELQRFSMMVCLLQKANVYLFDEPSSFLDVRQRLQVAASISECAARNNGETYVVVVEHDLTMLDFMSDAVCVMYGSPSFYGVSSFPLTVNDGFHDYLRGISSSDNMSFRNQNLSLTNDETLERERMLLKPRTFQYPPLVKKVGNFEITVEEGEFQTSQIVVFLGENATGKSTLMKILAGKDSDLKGVMQKTKISYKPQSLDAKYEGRVGDLLNEKLNFQWVKDLDFNTYIFQVCQIESLFSREFQTLSGGELQRLGLTIAFGKEADLFLIDEPSAYLDCEYRLMIAKGIKKFVLKSQKTAFIVEHDFIMATYLADKVIVFEGEPGKKCTANKPMNMVEGMNKFLSILQITFRRDPSNGRPRINKLDSILDKNQKLSGNYFYAD